MKSFVLVECDDKGVMEDLVEAIPDNLNYSVNDTSALDEDAEYKKLNKYLKHFKKVDSEVMLIRFSGKESIIKNFGEEHPEMIVNISYNNKSKYYTECPKKILVDLINIFSKETN